MRLFRALAVFFTVLMTGKEPGQEKVRDLAWCDQGRHGPWIDEAMGMGWDRSTCDICGYYEDNGHRGQCSRPYRKGDPR